jgi:hypothetical protein
MAGRIAEPRETDRAMRSGAGFRRPAGGRLNPASALEDGEKSRPWSSIL